MSGPLPTSTPRREGQAPPPARTGGRLHHQIVLPVVAVALMVGVVAAVVAARELSWIVEQWASADTRQTMASIQARLEEDRRAEQGHVVRLARDDRLSAALAAAKGTPDTSRAAAFLEDERRDHGHDELMVLRADGVVVATSDGVIARPGMAIVSPELLRSVSSTGTRTTLVRVGGRETMVTVARCRGRAAYFVGLADVLTDELLARSFRGAGVALAYLDRRGSVIASFVDTGSLDARAAADLRSHLHGDDPAVVAAIAGPADRPGEIRSGPDRYRVVARPIMLDISGEGAADTGSIVVAVSTAAEDGVSGTLLQIMALLSVVGVATLATSGVVVARRVSLPLGQLSDSAKRVADGDFSHRVEITGRNEIADLAESFNSMTDSLRQRTESITKKVLELGTLYEMSRSLGLTLDLDVLLGSMLDAALRLFGVESGYVVLRDRATDELVLQTWRGITGPVPTRDIVRQSMCEWVTREGRPLIVNPSAEGEGDGGRIDTITGATSALCVPLVSSEGIIGAVTVGSRDPASRFTGDDVRLLSTIANHATTAVGNIELFSSLQEAYIATVRSLAAAVDAKDPYTRGHSERVAEYAMMIAEQLGMSAEQRTALEMSAYLHDIGKIGIREELLLKPGRLDDDEMAQMRHHPLIGANILRPVAFPWAIVPVVRHHHEHWDGRGYPAGLRVEEIPLLARILSVADSFEAMISDRPYRRGRTVEEGLAELERCSGTQFDPRIVVAFLAAMSAGANDVAASQESAESFGPAETRGAFVALCDGMLGSFRRLGGPRLSSNLETELNRYFTAETLPFSFAGGRMSLGWDEAGPADDGELRDMRRAVAAMAATMARTAGTSLVDGFYEDALAGLSVMLRRCVECSELYRRA